MGLPEVKVSFQAPVNTTPLRAERGVLAIVVQDDTEAFDYKTYATVSEMDTDDYTETNYASIAAAFIAGPFKVIVVRVDTTDAIADATAILDGLAYDWVCTNAAGFQSGLVSYVKSINTDARARKVKCLATGAGAADDMHIVNVANSTVTLAGDSSTTAMNLYLPRLAGILAACPLDRSVTSWSLEDISAVAEVSGIDASIDAGNLCLYKDDQTFRIARGVNTLQAIGGSTNKTADMKKICVVEGMDRTQQEIIMRYKSEYKGRRKNDSDNQALFLSDVLAVLADLAVEKVLDDASVPTAEIDVDAMRTAWATLGVDVTGLPDALVKDKTIGSKVFIVARNLKYLDAMEDMSMVIQLEN